MNAVSSSRVVRCRVGILLVAMVACRGNGHYLWQSHTGDSAGIPTLTVMPPGVLHPGWRATDSPRVDIGTLEGEEGQQLYGVADALQLDDGRFVIANRGTSELRFYDRAGRFQYAAGGAGAGPGEFRAMGWLRKLAGESLLVFDGSFGRASIYTTQGRFVRSLGFESQFVWPIGVLDDNSLLIGVGVPLTGAAGSGLVRDSALYVRYSMTGELLDTVGTFPSTERYISVEGGVVNVVMRPFGHHTQAAVCGGQLVVGDGRTYALNVHSPDGVLSRLVRVRRTLLPVRQVDIEEVQRRPGGTPRARAARARTLARVPFPETMPAFERLVPSPNGGLWVQDFHRFDDSGTHWTVFDSTWSVMGMVSLPPRFRLLRPSGRSVLGVWRDSVDVEHVQLRDLVRVSQ